jgi:hypothetical protein
VSEPQTTGEKSVSNSKTFQVSRAKISDTQLHCEATITSKDLMPGQVLLKVDRFAFTANNITYAALGEQLSYWEFFPAAAGKGIIPVWGFADVEASRCDDIDVGERLYGYYPMATHLVVEPGQVSPRGFVDHTRHRAPLPIIYNQYIRCSQDPIYSEGTESLQMILRPLFTTSFLLDDFFASNQFFGATTLVLTSASSKTALGMAFLLNQNRDKRDFDYEIVGLTSPGNLEFVKGLGCYDRVLTYAEVSELDAGTPTATIDFAGNGELLGKLHALLSSKLQYSCLVGVSHWDQRGGLPEDLAGPAPQMFFAPTQAELRLKEMGAVAFQQAIADAWFSFIEFVDPWMTPSVELGPDAVARVYQEVLAGRLDPASGYVLSLWES